MALSEFGTPRLDPWQRLLRSVHTHNHDNPKEKVSQERYIFIQSLKHEDLPHNPSTEQKVAYVVTGILRCIPIVSIAIEAPILYESIKNRVIYEFFNDKEYVYDVRFSSLSIIQSVIHALGLGILLVPFRLVADFLHSTDKGSMEPFSNPHLLNKSDWQWAIWDVRGTPAEKLFPYFPENKEFCYQILMRDHHLHPELLFNTLYPSSIDTEEDKALIEKFNRLVHTNKEFRELLYRKT